MNRQVVLRDDDWGITKGPEGYGRRIFVADFPIKTRTEDLYRFFGTKELMEGFKRRGTIVFIQYKNPKDCTFALMKNSQTFMGCTIRVEPYREFTNTPKRPKSAPRSSSPVEMRQRRRHRSRTRSRTRSRSRSLSSEPAPRMDYKRGDRNETLSRNNPEAEPKVDDWGRPIQVPSVAQQIPTPAQQGSESAGDLPMDINLTLQLLMVHKNASSLSVIQIQSLINYFESVKIAILNNNTPYNNGNINESAYPPNYQGLYSNTEQMPRNPNVVAEQSRNLAQNGNNLRSQRPDEDLIINYDDEQPQEPVTDNIKEAAEKLKNIFS